MTIQINTDNHIEGHDRMEEYFKGILEEQLKRFDDKITRLEVHLGDENSDKFGTDDKRCLIEVRLAGKQPIAVTNHSDSTEKSFMILHNQCTQNEVISYFFLYSRVDKFSLDVH